MLFVTHKKCLLRVLQKKISKTLNTFEKKDILPILRHIYHIHKNTRAARRVNEKREMSSVSGACSDHSACADSNKYCASATDGSGRCRPCEECATFADGITGKCPAICNSSSDVPDADSSSYTSEEFFNAYTYWNRVKDEGFEVSNKGCESSAIAATTSTSGSLKGRTGKCVPSFTKKDEDKWCSMETLTQTHPFRSCIASEANDYCGVGASSVCISDSYFDCCPIEEGPIAGVAITVILVLIALQYFLCKACHRRKLIAGADTWENPKLKRDATMVIEKHPKLTEKVLSKKESRKDSAPASEKA